jgi:RHS repeat-associated protein
VLDGATTVYNLEYQYDQLGNRTWKKDYVANRQTDYYYDSDPANRDPDWQTNNNRLLWYTEKPIGGAVDRTVSYVYYKTGNCSNITIKDVYPGSGDPAPYEWYYDVALYYDLKGNLWRAIWDKWKLDQQGEFSQYTKLSGREFYCDGGRERWLDRDIDPETLAPLNGWRWSDYDGEQPYGDFTFTPGEANPTEQVRYLDGMGPQAVQTVSSGATKYLHGDLTRSTNATSDGASGTFDSGGAAGPFAYTAFGEHVGAGDPTTVSRYGYNGGWGYESGLLSLQGANTNLPPITLQHVGARWYQPGIGRFIQRDPIGIDDGLNVYGYCDGEPANQADATGLMSSLHHPKAVALLVEMGMAGFIFGSKFAHVAARNIPISVTAQCIRLGQAFWNPIQRSLNYWDPLNKVTVATNPRTGEIITVFKDAKPTDCWWPIPLLDKLPLP